MSETNSPETARSVDSDGRASGESIVQRDEASAAHILEHGLRARIPAPAWHFGLIRTEEGRARPVLANAIYALRHAPIWAGVLWHDTFSTITIARRPPPWMNSTISWSAAAWSDGDDVLTAEWLQRQGIKVPASIAAQAVEAVAREREFHPVRDYLDGLSWDGRRRIDRWLIDYVGAADAPYVRAIGSRWLISAVARIARPGCKANCALILEGPQGIRESSALNVLGRPWFTDRLSDLASKDAALETRGVWIIEIAELDTMSRAEVGTIKAFMSRTQDRFRPPYGKRLIDLPRQCVFAGSINPEGGYLKDATGGRRFWPVVCGSIDLAALEPDRDQLWAEARERFAAGEPWWLDTRELDDLAAEQQADRYQGDACEGPITSWLQHDVEWLENGYGERVSVRRLRERVLDDVSIGEVLDGALCIEHGRWTQLDQNRVARCLVSMGFKQYRARHGAERERRYRRCGSATAGLVRVDSPGPGAGAMRSLAPPRVGPSGPAGPGYVLMHPWARTAARDSHVAESTRVTRTSRTVAAGASASTNLTTRTGGAWDSDPRLPGRSGRFLPGPLVCGGKGARARRSAGARMAKLDSAAVTKAAFAERVGLTRGRISQLIAKGLPVTVDGCIAVESGLRWMEDDLDPDRRGKGGSAAGSTPSLAEARRLHEIVKFQRAKLAFERERGELVNRSVVKGAVFARAKAERDAHMAWVARATPLLAAEIGADPARTFSALDRLMREHLLDLARLPLPELRDG